MKMFWSICFICLALPAFADQIRTIQLQHRLAAEILPMIEPMIDNYTTINGHDNLLIIKSSSQSFNEIEQLVKQLDSRVQSLTVTVLRTQQQINDERFSNDQLNIDLENPKNSSLEINRWSTKNSRERDQQYQARGIAGQPIDIQMGRAVADNQQQLIFYPHGGIAVQESTQYIQLDNGFQARVNILGNQQARVDIFPLFSEMQRNGDITSTSLLTTVNGPVNQWILIGQIGEQQRQQQNAKTYRSHQDEQQWLYLKIELN
ncbi:MULTISPECIES: secretin N-terminal domain-containing protein [unclassified Methylophaga]|jgi:hypothetical protein|uniref:secretin N-terminal domain-containing protein n=1 Tax=unclassified Methylophaga TaxID=2629249 RepID=UPI000C8C0A84|nr:MULTISPECIES: secretin N-terminal domain-containing protein [unclassified Methylophaga]MAK67697.1 hypothetical protein [Methylophaga sp.]MAY18931.1 hypothetical protein [Methylophaga sp.]HAO25404.1 hypothetical protein [Methylophaga sp.]HCD04753.1 hypothetical protein [Methylophaga sp.]|tara:strand:- start:9560 stop:10342 length:783 start_codon:yes stop_codon:yes gene_type:complete